MYVVFLQWLQKWLLLLRSSVEFCRGQKTQTAVTSCQSKQYWLVNDLASQLLSITQNSGVKSCIDLLFFFSRKLIRILKWHANLYLSPLQDPVSWGDVASFEMSEAATPPRHKRANYTSLLQEKTLGGSAGFATKTLAAITNVAASASEKSCAQFAPGAAASLSPVNASKPTQGPASRRRKERGEASPLCDRIGASFLENVSLNSPKKTPTKSLPFTPSRVSGFILVAVIYSNSSTNAEEAFVLIILVCPLRQFCNISGVEHLNLDNPALTSTPMCGQRCLFNTPLQKETTPRHQKENDM